MPRKTPSHTQSADLQRTLEQCNQLLQSKKYKKALIICERYLAAMPDNPYVLSLAGVASDLNRQPDNAVDYFRRAVALAPNEASFYYNLAKSLKQTNNIQEAISTYQKALELAPENQTILFNFGNLYLSQEKPADAIPLFQKLLDINPKHTRALRGLGTALRLIGQLEMAKNYFLKAHELAPEDSDTLTDLGDICRRLDQLPEAESYYREAIKLSPNDPSLYSDLGIILNSLDKNSEAIDSFRTALNIDPTHVPALNNLGKMLKSDKPEEAREYLIRADELLPNNVDIITNLAYSYDFLGELAKAEPLYRKAIKLASDRSSLHFSLGRILNFLGKQTEAIDSFRTAIKLEPEYVDAYQQLAEIIKHKEHDDDIEKMEELLKRSTLDASQRSTLNFGLGKAYEDLQEYDKAFDHYNAANDLKRSTIKYNIADDRRLIESIIRVFDAKLLEQFKSCGHPSDNPIFIVGMPRSGTTLTEQILSRHPDVYGAGELKDMVKLIDNYFKQELKSRFPQNIERLDCQSIDRLGKRYCQMTSRHNENARHITNKMPYNFLTIGMIRLMLPNAKIIHCSRNPLDTCFSCYSKFFTEGNNYTYSLTELGQYYGLYHKLMQHWLQLPGIEFINVTYEELVNDQETQTRRLLDACDLEWNDACLDFHKSDRPVMTASVNQVRKGLYNKSVQRWKHFESHLAPLIDILRSELSDTSWLS